MDLQEPRGIRDMGSGDEGGGSGYDAAKISASTERELALRMITSRAIVDAGFYGQLRADPRAAIEALHISLTDDDMARFEKLNWENIDEHVKALRDELGLGSAHVLRGAW